MRPFATIRPVAWATIALVAVVAGCARPSGDDTSSTAPVRSFDTVRSAKGMPSDDPEPVTGQVPEDILAEVVADAERRTGADPASIEVVRAESVTWNDGSLGCPEPGFAYTQALVDGYHIVLEVDGEPLDYRVGSGADIRLCEGPPIEGGG